MTEYIHVVFISFQLLKDRFFKQDMKPDPVLDLNHILLGLHMTSFSSMTGHSKMTLHLVLPRFCEDVSSQHNQNTTR